MKSNLKCAFAALLVAIAAIPAYATGNCVLQQVASLPMAEDHDGTPSVQMTIGGRPFTMLVNTGDALSILTEPAAQSLGLSAQSFNFRGGRNYGGQIMDRYVVAHDIQIGSLKAESTDFAFMPRGRMPESLDGAISSDILRRFDVEFDFANGRLNLYSQDHCLGQFAHWTDGEYAVVPFRLDELGRIVIRVQLDGIGVPAVLHTGYTRSIMPLEEAYSKIGGDEIDSKKYEVMIGKTRYFHYPFKTMTFEGVTVNNPDILLGAMGDPYSADWTMIFGLGVLRRFHLYVAYREHMIYLTPATAH